MKPEYLRTIVQLALAEDIGQGDITTDNLIPSKSQSQAKLIAKSSGILCGIKIAEQVFKTLNPKISFRSLKRDGQPLRKGDIIASISGPTRVLLTGERVALNFLTLLSGIATTTAQYVQAIKPYKVKVLDTRKTTPLLRQLERYAVRCGGGDNHRFNLNDMGLIKDNHLIASDIKELNANINCLKKKLRAKVEIEVDTLAQLKEVLGSKADFILLDNMTPKQIAHAVRLRNKAKSKALLEASGGINLKNIKKYAATGVDRISVGALTHSHQALDISMELFVSLRGTK